MEQEKGDWLRLRMLVLSSEHLQSQDWGSPPYSNFRCNIHDVSTTEMSFDMLKPDHPSNDALHGKPLIVCLHWNLEEIICIH